MTSAVSTEFLAHIVAGGLSLDLRRAVARLAVIDGPASLALSNAADAKATDLAQRLFDPAAGEPLALELLAAIWPSWRAPTDALHVRPEHVEAVPPTWWRSPAGLAIAAALAPNAEGSVSHAVAAPMLGIQRTSIGTAITRSGYLVRAPGGGVTLASVLAKLGRDGHENRFGFGPA